MLNPWALVAAGLAVLSIFLAGFGAGTYWEGAKAAKLEAARQAEMAARNAVARAAEVEVAKRDFKRQERIYAEFQSLSTRARRVGGPAVVVTSGFTRVWDEAVRAANSAGSSLGSDKAGGVSPPATAPEVSEEFVYAYDPADIAEWNVEAARAFALRSLQLEACVERYKIIQTQCNATQAETH